MVKCVGDDIVTVGVRLSDSSIRPPFGLKAEDDPISAAKKAGFQLTDEQKKKENWRGYLEVIDSKRGLLFYFMNGRLFEVWKEKPSRRAED